MRELIMRKLNGNEDTLNFTVEEMMYIIDDWISLHTKCPINYSFIGPPSEVDDIYAEVKIDRNSVVNY